MGIFGILIGDRIQSHTMKKAYGPLLFLTSVSAGWWTWTIVNGDGFDLRPYLFAQFFPLLAMLIVLFFFLVDIPMKKIIGEVYFSTPAQSFLVHMTAKLLIF